MLEITLTHGIPESLEAAIEQAERELDATRVQKRWKRHDRYRTAAKAEYRREKATEFAEALRQAILDTASTTTVR